jgi:hypothetical protein
VRASRAPFPPVPALSKETGVRQKTTHKDRIAKIRRNGK